MMSNLLDIDPDPVEITIGKTKKELKFDLRAFKAIEKQLGSITNAFNLLNDNDTEAVTTFIWAGLLHENPKVKKSKTLTGLKVEEVADKLSEAIKVALCEDCNFFESLDWSLLYYTGTVSLNMSEESFWNSTPRKIVSLIKIHGEVKGNNNQKEMTNNQAIQAFKSW